MKFRLFSLLLAIAVMPFFAQAQEIVTVTDATINAGETYNMTADKTYLLDGLVFVEDGAVLNIEPGTVIKAKPGDGDNASALIIARGGKIFAEGTPNNPIIFTAESDDLNNPDDMKNTDNPENPSAWKTGQWGGVIILGKAGINIPGGESNIEGIDEDNPLGKYGGNDDDDNSGVFRYVSIRHGGTKIGPKNEINGLTLGGVGRGTVIEYVEVFANADDGIEWFGGTVNCRYMLAAFAQDDSFDYDQGWRGNGQFWLAIQDAGVGDKAGEFDGGDKPNVDTEPFGTPTIFNATYIGSGSDSENLKSAGLNIKENGGGYHYNSIYTDFATFGIQVEDTDGQDSRQMMDDGMLVLANNLWYGFGDGNTIEAIAPQDFVQAHLGANNNWIEDPMLTSISRDNNAMFDPRPMPNSPAYQKDVMAFPDGHAWFYDANYIGAFDSGRLWIRDWTTLDAYGFLPAPGENIVEVVDNDIREGMDVYWTANNTYLLNGLVFVEEGATLHIEPGTVVKARPGGGDNASALIIARGGKIMAEGTPSKPIIFTAEADDVNNPNDLAWDATGLWGGVIILGKSSINIPGGESNIEGIDEDNPKGRYGGTDDADNSGVFKYVSIRHGGTKIGPQNEINGLTMGGVGNGTVIEYVEVYSNQDDGFEWFGGTVNCRYLVSAFNQDDSFDYDQGWRGNGQFWFVIQHPGEGLGDKAGEYDGGDKPNVDAMPYGTPAIYNVTYIGSGMNSSNLKSAGFNIKENGGGYHHNSIFTEFTTWGIQVEDTDGQDSRKMMEDGMLVLGNNIWWNFGDGNTIEAIAPQDFVQAHLGANNNWIEDPMLGGINWAEGSKGLDPRPAANSTAFTNATAEFPADHGWFYDANYLGAFGPGNLWINDWTYLDHRGFLPDPVETIVEVVDSDIPAGSTVTWTNNNTYLLNGLVFVDEGATLNIQEGTVIKARPGSGDNASALIVARGGKIFANGTAENPIIFTAEEDDVNNPTDLSWDATGLWGGVIILGKAGINIPGGEANIEGIDEDNPKGIYGGGSTPINDDNSGELRYVSIRHGGSKIGPQNEINGLTLGGVGSGTTIEYIEVFSNQDDGFEWFGGTVNCKYLVSAFNQDDSFDYDQGWRGNGQFWFVIQHPGEGLGDKAGEYDGGDKPNVDTEPYGTPTIYNATFIGSGMNSSNLKSAGFNIKENGGGYHHNSIFTEFTTFGVQVEDTDGQDSRKMMEDGMLVLGNNIWWNFGDGNTIEAIAPQDFVQAHLAANNNWIEDPQLGGISWTEGERGLDPRINWPSPARTYDLADYPASNFFDVVDYIGAFPTGLEDSWLNNWTYLDARGFVGDLVSVEEDITTGKEVFGIYPNPASANVNIQFNMETAANLTITIYNVLGNKVAEVYNGFQNAGVASITYDAANLVEGTYYVTFDNGAHTITKQLVIVR